MFLASAIVSTVLAALLVYAAVRKLSHRPEVVASYKLVNVPEERLNLLAITLLAGAAGLLLGLVWKPIGIAAGVALAIYFLVAISAHIRSRDQAHIATPIAIEILAVAATVVRIAS